MSSITFTSPLNPPLTKGDLWQDFVLHCFAKYVAASKSQINRLEISMGVLLQQEKQQCFSCFRCGGRPRTAHIYIPPKSPFDKGGLMARPCLALLCNMSGGFKVVDKSVRNFDGESYYNRRNIAVSPVFVALHLNPI